MADYLPYLQGTTAAQSSEGEQNFDEQDTANRLNNQLKANDLTQQSGANDAEGAYLQALYGNQNQVGQAKSAAAQGYVAQPVQPGPKDSTSGPTTPASLTATTSSPTYQPPTTGLAAQQPAAPVPPAAVAAAQQSVANSPLPVTIAPGTGLDTPAGQATLARATAPAPGMQPVAPPTAAGQTLPPVPAWTPPAGIGPAPAAPATGPNGQPLVQATPFDNNQFMQNLTAKLANTPGAAAELMKIKEQRDQQLNSIFQMAANGSPDEAQFLAQQNGFQIPDSIIQNGNVTQGLNLAQKAYPDEPDKGQAFFKAFTGTQGTIDDKVQAGIAAGGSPSGLAQRELMKAMSLTKAMVVPVYGPNGTMSIVRPGDNTATPVVNTATGQDVSGIVGSGKNMRVGAASLTNAGVAQPMTPYQLATIKGRATVNVDNMISNSAKYGNATPPTPAERQAMIDTEVNTLTGSGALGAPATGLGAAVPNVQASPSAPSAQPAASPAAPAAVPPSAVAPSTQANPQGAPAAPVPPPAPVNAPGTPFSGAQGPVYGANDQSIPAILSRAQGTAPGAPVPAPLTGNGATPTVQTPMGAMPNPDGQQPPQPRPSSYVVISPTGQPVSVPANRLQAALDSGGRLAQ